VKLSIIIPAYNEEENIAEVIRQVENTFTFPYELVVVNDHSTDNTRRIVEDLRAKYKNIKFADNTLERGFANALRTGFRNSSGDAVIPVMADLCDDLLTIKAMLGKIEEGYDIVCGSRYIKSGARFGGPKLKGFLSFLAGKTLRYLLGVPTSDIANSFKMYRKKILETISIESKHFEVSMEIVLKSYFLGYKIREVPTVWHERTKGKSSFKVFKLLPYYLKWYIWAFGKKPPV
jgi:dolichol-phosphate mannosyltransferase